MKEQGQWTREVTQLKSDHVKVHSALRTDWAQIPSTVGPHSLSYPHLQHTDSEKFPAIPVISYLKYRIVSFNEPINPSQLELKNKIIFIFLQMREETQISMGGGVW